MHLDVLEHNQIQAKPSRMATIQGITGATYLVASTIELLWRNYSWCQWSQLDNKMIVGLAGVDASINIVAAMVHDKTSLYVLIFLLDGAKTLVQDASISWLKYTLVVVLLAWATTLSIPES